jgi:hypothetical protein
MRARYPTGCATGSTCPKRPHCGTGFIAFGLDEMLVSSACHCAAFHSRAESDSSQLLAADVPCL